MKSAAYPFLAGILLVCILFMTGCTENSLNGGPVIVITPVNGTPVVFNESDNGKTYVIPQNMEFWINLTETYATNQPWLISLSPGLEVIDSQYFRNPKMPRPDIEGTHRWILKATGLGDQSFFAETGWYNKDDPRSRYVLSLRIISGSG
jgi:predicted secreted protein